MIFHVRTLVSALALLAVGIAPVSQAYADNRDYRKSYSSGNVHFVGSHKHHKHHKRHKRHKRHGRHHHHRSHVKKKKNHDDVLLGILGLAVGTAIIGALADGDRKSDKQVIRRSERRAEERAIRRAERRAEERAIRRAERRAEERAIRRAEERRAEERAIHRAEERRAEERAIIHRAEERRAATHIEPWTASWYNYCARKYRSFNPDTGTYRGYDGYDHFCIAK